MNKFFPLVFAGLLLAGCADDASNPWANDSDKANQRVENALQATPSGPQLVGPATADTPLVTQKKYPWDNKLVGTTPPQITATAPELETGKAKVLAIRGDVGIILIKCVDMPTPGEQVILVKDDKALALVVYSVTGDEVVANILPNQVSTPVIAISDVLVCRRLNAEEKK